MVFNKLKNHTFAKRFDDDYMIVINECKSIDKVDFGPKIVDMC